MPDRPSTWADILHLLAASALIQMIGAGAAGGLTNALVTEAERRRALRLIVIGALVASGIGSLGSAVLVWWLGVPASAVPTGAGIGPVAYLLGLFGAPVIELILARIKAGRLPVEGEK